MSITMATSSILSAPPCSGNNDRLLSAVRSTSTSYLTLDRNNGSYYNLLSLRCSLRTRNKYIIAASNESVQLVSTALSDISSALAGRKGWIAGLLLAVLLPFFTNKWGPNWLLFKDKLDADLQKAEDVVETVEKAAEGLDKAAEDLAENLPEGSSLKNAVIFVEHAAEEVIKDAHLADLAIGKFHELEEEAEAYVKSQSNKGSKTNEGKKAKATIKES